MTAEEKALFEKLISVSGIGPTLAIKVLSGLATAGIIDAIRGGQVEQLVRIPGVGRRPLSELVLELKDKMEGLGSWYIRTGSFRARAEPALSGIGKQDVLSALLNLGCNRSSAEAAVRKAKTFGPDSGFEPMFRKALELVR